MNRSIMNGYCVLSNDFYTSVGTTSSSFFLLIWGVMLVFQKKLRYIIILIDKISLVIFIWHIHVHVYERECAVIFLSCIVMSDLGCCLGNAGLTEQVGKYCCCCFLCLFSGRFWVRLVLIVTWMLEEFTGNALRAWRFLCLEIFICI